jgi:hypothetical protein
VSRWAGRWGATVGPCFLAAGCVLGPGVTPSPLKGYRVLIEAHDSLSDHMARALSRKGFMVRRQVQGGSLPTAALVTFTFRELGPPSTIWFHARLADTRSGAIVAAVSTPLDSLGSKAANQAKILADSFAARLAPQRISPP